MVSNSKYSLLAVLFSGVHLCLCETLVQQECVRGCMMEFSSQTDAIFDEHVQRSIHISSLSYKDLVALASSVENKMDTKMRFGKLCQAYKTMRKCVTRCPRTDLEIVKHDPLKFICIERRKDFEEHIDCLAANEPFVEKRCERETNRTNKVTTELTQAYQHPSSHMPRLLGDLCGSVSDMVKCIVPETALLCGTSSADVVKDLIVQSFDRLTSLFNDMNMQIPSSCKKLGEIEIRSSRSEASHEIPDSWTTGAATDNCSHSKFLVFLCISFVYFVVLCGL